MTIVAPAIPPTAPTRAVGAGRGAVGVVVRTAAVVDVAAAVDGGAEGGGGAVAVVADARAA
jgi:hypothetical protein